MIALWALALADPGRTTSGLSLGSDGEAWHVRGHLEHGVTRWWTLAGESALEETRVSTAAGVHLELVDTRWWRLGVAALPELVVERAAWIEPLRPPPPELGARLGLRGSWLAFWGLSFTARVDGTVGGGPPGVEAGAGLAVRL